MKLLSTLVLSVGMLVVLPMAPSVAETLDGSDAMWDCPQADGTSVYTNKERSGCQALTLKPLSVVPDVATLPAIPQITPDMVPNRDRVRLHNQSSRQDDRTVPYWARDWHASIAPSGSVQEEVCSLYSEWMRLVLKTSGGFFFGSDSSYGADLTGLTQRGPSYSYYDNARYLPLSRLFGRGFVPVRCP